MPRSRWTSDTAVLIYIALATVVIHVAAGNRYGFHRDELATLDDARHLAWGFVAYPPMTPFFGRLSLILFGDSLAGFRFFAAGAQAIGIVLTGLMAREMGGGRKAQIVAVAAALPFSLAAGSMMQYVSFDNLCWILTAYCVTKLLRSEDPRWWLAVGASLGAGMMAKYGIGFLAIGVAIGTVLTNTRRYLKSKWLWGGVALAILIMIPNLVWEARHHFITLDFLKHIHERDVSIGRTKDFLPDQLQLTLAGAPLALAGLIYCFTRQGKRFGLIGWMYVLPLVMFVIAKGRGYYMAAAYPMLYAAGAVWVERGLARVGRVPRTLADSVIWLALATDIALVVAFFLPLAPPGTRWFEAATKINGDLVEELGWPELVQEVARIRDSLSPQERARLGIFTANYGEAGALSQYGPKYGLPTPISGVNSYSARGYGDPPPETLIVLGFSQSFRERIFTTCELAGHVPNPYGVQNEETHDHPEIYLCRGPRQSWPELWKEFQWFG